MILKQSPEDFQVEESTDLQPSAGPFSLYRLEKKGWTTPDALQAIQRRWRLDRRRLSYGGLKDRHAQTIQYFTIFHGPQRRLTHHNVAVTYLGQVPGPYRAEQIRGNRFQIILRDVSRAEQDHFSETFEEVRAFGVPNYFDDQRFGSVVPPSRKSPVGGWGSGDRDQEPEKQDAFADPCPLAPDSAPSFVAKSIILGRYEEALRMALTGYYAHDRRDQKTEKAILRAHWGNWPRCKELLSRGHARSLIDYLVGHPEDLRGALARLRPELRGLYLSAYQSHLWNRMVAAWLRAQLRPDQLVAVGLKLGQIPVHRILDDLDLNRLRELVFPLPSQRVLFACNDPRQPFFDQVLREEGLTQEQFKLRGFREMFFSRGDRPALCLPTNLKYTSAADETHRNKQKLCLNFELPRGSYATLIVKRLTASLT